MRFVLGNRLLDRAGGTEVHMLTVAEQLQRLGHETCLYSPVLGPFTDHVRTRGIDAFGALRELPAACDVVVSQDALVAYDLAERYPEAFHVFRICGDVFDFQLPPQLPGVVDLIVVLSERYARVGRACAVDTPMLRLRVPLDVDRLTPVGRLRARPHRAALLGNYGERDDIVRAAWGPHGVEVIRIGGPDQRYDIASALADVDIVVGKGRAALDGMACGRAVYVFDVLGGDGWVTPASYAALEQDNFAGQATDRVLGVAELDRDLAGYEPAMGVANRDLIAQHHNGLDHVVALLDAIAARQPVARAPAPLRELARLTALQWSWERLAHGMQEERAAWVARIQRAEGLQARAETEVADARVRAAADVAELRRELADVVAAAAGERVAAAAREAQHAQARAAARAEADRAGSQQTQLASQQTRLASQETQLASQRAQLASLHTQLASITATRAWRLAVGYWRLRDRVRAVV